MISNKNSRTSLESFDIVSYPSIPLLKLDKTPEKIDILTKNVTEFKPTPSHD